MIVTCDEPLITPSVFNFVFIVVSIEEVNPSNELNLSFDEV